MAGKVSKLTKKEESEACVHLNRDIGDNIFLRQGYQGLFYLSCRGRRIEGVVDVVGDVAGEAPVVAAVLEQVHDRHRGVGEPVDEDGLQQALGIVANP